MICTRTRWSAVVALFVTSLTILVPLVATHRGALAMQTGFTGTVTDLATEAPISGVRVSAGGAEAVTDTTGRYTLPLPPNTYDVRAEASGYIGMTQRLRRTNDEGLTPLDFEMVLTDPTDAQAAIIEEKLTRAPGAGLDVHGLATPLELGASSVQEVPDTIRVLMPDGSVQVMAMEDYLKGVVPNEMPPHWPREALKAQAVASRSFAATRRAHLDVGADVCTTSHCQAWSPISYDTTDQAVESTAGISIRYDGTIVHGYYFAQCDGHTRNSEDVWGGYLPYARSVACVHDGDVLRGHGVGMCQYGARILAEQGLTYAEILERYYTGSEVTANTPQSVTNARVTPASGDRGTLFVYEAVYQSGSRRPPAVANVIINGNAHALYPVPDDSTEGQLYRYETYLPPGSHTYRFYFDDGSGQVVRAPGSGSLTGPTVAGTGSPPAASTAEGTIAKSVTHSTPQDWEAGTRHGVRITSHGDGAIALQSGLSSGIYTSTPLQAPIEFLAVGVDWYAQTPGGATISLELRTSLDGQNWTAWQPVVPDEHMDVGALQSSDLIFGHGSFLQYRATLTAGRYGEIPVLENIRLVCIDSSEGPSAVELADRVGTNAATMPPVIDRAGWGANEAYRTLEPEYRPVSAIIVHHTATSDGGVDPAAMVRAIYYYHAVTRGWGDIGYNYLIDKYGNVYQGRYGGPGVVGHHAGWYNYGSVGVSLIGNYDENTVPQVMLSRLTDLLAALCADHWLNPLGEAFFIDKVLPTIMGHRDVGSTTCPGRYAYALLPQIRSETSAKATSQPPRLDLLSPKDGETVRGAVRVALRDNPAITSVEYYVNGALRASQSQPPYVWKWDTPSVADGSHTLRVVARNQYNDRAEASRTVRVDNTPPSGTVTAPTWTASAWVLFRIESQDATAVQFSNGWTWEGEELQHENDSKQPHGRQVADSGAINGKAWEATGSDGQGVWFGPYTLDLPAPQDYDVYFRLKTPQRTSATLGRIDVADNLGHRVYAERVIVADDFPVADVYEEFSLALASYEGTSPTWQGIAQNGLEFRTWFYGAGGLTLDRVSVFGPRLDIVRRTGQPTYVYWVVRPEEGIQTVTARLLDEVGNFHDVPVTVRVDLTPPEVVKQSPQSVQVQDALSGLDTRTAQYTYSTDDGFTWSAWRDIPLPQPVGTNDPVTLQAPPDAGTEVRFRIRDVAGNTLEVPERDPNSLPPGQRISPTLPLIFLAGPR